MNILMLKTAQCWNTKWYTKSENPRTQSKLITQPCWQCWR